LLFVSIRVGIPRVDSGGFSLVSMARGSADPVIADSFSNRQIQLRLSLNLSTLRFDRLLISAWHVLSLFFFLFYTFILWSSSISPSPSLFFQLLNYPTALSSGWQVVGGAARLGRTWSFHSWRSLLGTIQILIRHLLRYIITLPRAYDVWPDITQVNRIVPVVHEECTYLMYVVHNKSSSSRIP